MNKIRTKIYVKATPERHEIIYSGIEFAEFTTYLSSPIENILLLKADYIGNRSEKNFELIEGKDYIAEFKSENIYNYGDFCFVDYASTDSINKLSGEQIAELLYMAHMYIPLQSPFFEALQNRFAYLAHDDGFYCKLYCHNLLDFVTVLCNKIKMNIRSLLNDNVCEAPNNVKEKVLQLAMEGLFIDLDELSHEDGMIAIKLYTVGTHSDMDIISNSCQQIKLNSSQVKKPNCRENEWTLS